MPILNTDAVDNSVISNPEPVIDIVVNVPSDYEGTFLDFKDELTAKLVAQGMDPSTFRIVSGAIKIDTTDNSNWYVYDHYVSQATYNSLGLNATKQPYQAADNLNASGANPYYIENLPSMVKQTCKYFARHISSSVDSAGKAKMVFVGYGSKALADYMIYPAVSDSRRTFSFDIDANGIDTHTLTGAGFFVNAGINSSGKLSGYLLFYQFSSATAGTIYLKKINSVDAKITKDTITNTSTATNIKSCPFSLSSTKKARIDVDLRSNSITAQQRNYLADGTFGPTLTMFDGKVTLDRTGYNGFGPVTAYSSHGCSSLSTFTFSDLEMTYEANAFEVLQSVQYSETAKYKYFINLTGANASANIPSDDPEAYLEGLTRLADNEIFYVSTINDGAVLTIPTATSSGVTPDNGLYATDDDYITQIASYITTNYNDNVQYTPVKLQETVPVPVSNFYIATKDSDGNEHQVMTAHLQHFSTSGESFEVFVHDKSIPIDSTLPITKYRLIIYDPDENEIVNSGFVDFTALPKYSFNRSSKQGKYIFELTVKDSAGTESTPFQTYLTTYLDDVGADIKAESLGNKSQAKITITDKGFGIDTDGITLVDGNGSGVMSYQINDGTKVKLSAPVHEYEVTAPLTLTPLKVTAWDECGNSSTHTFTTCQVSFDEAGYSTYYVLSGGKLGTLPESPVITDPDLHFKGWANESNVIVSSETTVTSSVKLHAEYTSDSVYLTFDANGGAFSDSSTTQTVKAAKDSKIIDYLLKGDQLPTKEGYDFTGWTLNSAAISEQVASTDGLVLKANWEVASFKLTFDANGGNLGKLKDKNVKYGSSILTAVTKDEAGDNYQGTYLPTREGYNFTGWAIDKAGTAISSSLTMPAAPYTVYANWLRDQTKYILTFDTAGGSTVTNKSYVRNDQPTYPDLPTSNRAGYTFAGWYYDDTLVKTGDTVPELRDGEDAITLTAHWTPNTDTQYKIEYYFYDGENYIRNDDFTLALQGTTEDNCEVDPETFFAKSLTELGYSIDGVDCDNTTLEEYLESCGYWFDGENSNNILTNTISGDGKTVIKICFKRYYNVGTNSVGNGTVTTFDGGIKEGTSPIVTWVADDGFDVKRIIIDYVVRDDLLDQDYYIFDDISLDHNVLVEFAQRTTPSTPTGYYNVNTSINGASGSCTINKSQSVAEGDNYTVSWQVSPGYYISSIVIDGVDYDVDTKSVELKGIKSDHDIVITTQPLPTIGGGTTKGYYTVTANCYGVFSDGIFASKSTVAKVGDTVEVDWSALGDIHVYAIYVDGVMDEDPVIDHGVYLVTDNIQKNYVVDIYFADDLDHFNREYSTEKVMVKTQLIGGPGTITGGAMIPVGSDYTVEWDVFQSTADINSDEYEAFEVYKVVVNGEEQSVTGNTLTLNDIESNQTVYVYVRPAIHNINVLSYGNGTVSHAKTVYEGQDYTFTAVPDSGYKIAKLVIDDEEITLTDAEKTNFTKNFSNIDKDHTIMAYFVADGEELDITNLVNVTVEFIDCTGRVNSGMGIFALGDEVTVNFELDEGYVPTKVTVNGVETDYGENMRKIMQLALRQMNYTVENTDGEYILNLGTVESGIVVLVYGENAPLDNNDDLPDFTPKNNYTVSAELIGGPGNISSGAKVEEGNSYTVDWELTNPKYEVREIVIDGISKPELITTELTGNYLFENIAEDHTIKVVIGSKFDINIDIDGDGIPDLNIDTDGDGRPDINIDLDGDNVPDINIDTDNTGIWSPSTEGGNADGIWKPDTNLDTTGDGKVDIEHGFREAYDNDKDGVDDSWKPSKTVYPNGITGSPYDTGSPLINIDTDGDGEPDVNIDTDGDGEPDVNIDTDDDGEPDTNIDTDGDGEPDVNIDTDGDGEPDVNLDTDGDGEPDVNIDTDGDGEPDVDIDTDGDGKPDINIDTDGDGEPDVNIDTDGDGEADINIDTNGDGKPNINIDTDGDGEADVNIDTDGDGVADKNIDRDNDGKPDLDVPITGDGLVIAIIAFIVILELSAFVTIRVIKRNGYSRLKLK
ncbi:MAG: InlB B-repeat-containing protein [Acutalibacteraceae bacterium]